MITKLFIIGSQKCGTTTLARWLDQHPKLSLCSDKEPSYFSIRFKEISERHYHNLFKKKEHENKLFFEASTSYTFYPFFPEVPKRIYKYNNEAKFIYIVRDPIERIKSHYKHNWIKGYTRKSFIEEVSSNPEYIFNSSYGLQLRQYLKYFSIEKFYVTSLEKLNSKKEEELNNIFNFIGIENLDFKDFNFKSQNVSSEILQIPFYKKYFSLIYPYINSKVKKYFKKLLSKKPNYEIKSSIEFESTLLEILANDKKEFQQLFGKLI